MNRKSLPESDPHHHTRKVKGMFEELIDHLRDDIEKMDDPRARAMFETSAEVITGLRRTFEHYEKGNEEAWR